MIIVYTIYEVIIIFLFIYFSWLRNTVLDTQKKITLHTYTHYHQSIKKKGNHEK
jgi:hypothetical protein